MKSRIEDLTEPFAILDHVSVYCGDSLPILTEWERQGKRFDLLLTDPPYGLNQKENKPSGTSKKMAKGAYDDDLFPDTVEYLNEVVRPIIDIALRICDLGIICGGVGSWKYLPSPKEEGCLFMPAAYGFNSWGHQDFRPIFYYGKPKGNVGKYRRLSHMVTESGFSKKHPCSKPLELWKKLMLCGTDGIQGKSILDPFGGSGTTGRAAQDLGMDAVLVELNPRYCQVIKENCSQGTLF